MLKKIDFLIKIFHWLITTNRLSKLYISDSKRQVKESTGWFSEYYLKYHDSDPTFNKSKSSLKNSSGTELHF